MNPNNHLQNFEKYDDRENFSSEFPRWKDFDKIDMNTISLGQLCELAQKQVRSRTKDLRVLGNWPDWIGAESLTDRIPIDSTSIAAGFDAGVACALDLIPIERQRLSAALHAAYTIEAVQQIRREINEGLDPNCETCWWLAACSICKEGTISQVSFLNQLLEFNELRADSSLRRVTALNMYEKMIQSYSFDRFGPGVPFGTVDGCIQGAYIGGYSFGVMYLSALDTFFIGTFYPSLGIPSGFSWSNVKDERGQPKSGPVFGSKQFVMCANDQEVGAVIRITRKYLSNE